MLLGCWGSAIKIKAGWGTGNPSVFSTASSLYVTVVSYDVKLKTTLLLPIQRPHMKGHVEGDLVGGLIGRAEKVLPKTQA